MQFSGLSTLLLLSMSTVISAAAVENTSTNVAEVIASLGDLRGDEASDPVVSFDDLLETEVELEDVEVLEKRETAKQATDRLLFKSSMATFQKAKKAKKPKSLNWTDNGCTWSPDKPAGFNFKPACQRHDFGYRNYKKQSRCTNANRLKIDNKFKSDLYAVCTPYGAIKEAACKKLANTYYNVVRKLGSCKS